MKTKKIKEPCGKGLMKLSLLVNNETTTNIPQMAEHFNQYFT